MLFITPQWYNLPVRALFFSVISVFIRGNYREVPNVVVAIKSSMLIKLLTILHGIIYEQRLMTL